MIRDNLEYARENEITAYTGGSSCVNDYFNLIRYRLESQFSKAFNMLDKTCSNSRGEPTGKRLLLLFHRTIETGFINFMPRNKRINRVFFA